MKAALLQISGGKVETDFKTNNPASWCIVTLRASSVAQRALEQ